MQRFPGGIGRHEPGGPSQRLAINGDDGKSGHKPAPLLVARNSGMMIGKEDS
jgi:hypothetical protein